MDDETGRITEGAQAQETLTCPSCGHDLATGFWVYQARWETEVYSLDPGRGPLHHIDDDALGGVVGFIDREVACAGCGSETPGPELAARLLALADEAEVTY